MEAITRAGGTYGLKLNWSKVEVLPIGCTPQLVSNTGQDIKQQHCMAYLGSVLCADGSSGSEVARRLGAAREELAKLSRVWKHSGISVARKVRIFEACILSKLLYNMHSLCLSIAETRRLDAFHVKCLRQVLRIPHSYISRVSNSAVLETANANLASHLLLERQLIWMGWLAVQPDEHVLRQSVFQSGDDRMTPKMPEGRKKRGRPRMCWARKVFQHAVQAAGSADKLKELWASGPAARTAWLRHVIEYCHNWCVGCPLLLPFSGSLGGWWQLDGFSLSLFSDNSRAGHIVCSTRLISLRMCCQDAHGYLLACLVVPHLVRVPISYVPQDGK